MSDAREILLEKERRDAEYPQLKDCIYLDHAGMPICADSLIDEHTKDRKANLYGNPHSDSGPSNVAGCRIESIRQEALEFFGADINDWDIVFVANATAAIKLITECLHDHAASAEKHFWYGYHSDSHTSLVGARELAARHHCFYDDDAVSRWFEELPVNVQVSDQINLLAYPGQSNMTGRRLPRACAIRERNCGAEVYTLLDAAALASTSWLNLRDTSKSPDFIALSFYKIFGSPHLGALIVQKRSASALFSRRYFGGGTVEMVAAIDRSWHVKKIESLHDALEDGTLQMNSIFELSHAIKVHNKLYGSLPMIDISHKTCCLARLMAESLHGLIHSNGQPAVKLYVESLSVFKDVSMQGPTLALNVLRQDGSFVPYDEVGRLASEQSIHLRTGSLCNPGGFAKHLEWTSDELIQALDAGHKCSKPSPIIQGKPTGVVRISLGAMSTKSDVIAFVRFMDRVFVAGCNTFKVSPRL